MPHYLLAHDLGTSGNKATLFSTDGELIKSTVYSYDTDYFENNSVEQDPADWWKAVCASSQEIVQGIDKNDIAAVSFSGQMMGCLCVDKNGVPLRKSIIWADQRSIVETGMLRECISEERFYNIVGHRMSPAYSIEKFMWVKHHESEIYRQTHVMLNAKDYIIYKLTGKFVTDYSDASGTNIFDLNTFTWSDEIIGISGIDGGKLPELHPSTDIIGEITLDAAESTGLAKGTPVVCGGGDGVCSAVGAGCVKEGIAYNYIGSSSWVAYTSKQPVYDDTMRTFNWAHSVPGYVTPCGTMQAAGGSFSWMKNELCRIETEEAKRRGISPYDLINSQIETSPPGAKGLLYLPYLLGERSPRWNPNARGAFIGLKMEHKREDILRAVVEGVFLNLNVILNVFKQHSVIDRMVVIGGGAQGTVERQIMADIYGLEILKPNYLEEATSMGAAVTAGVGVGALDSFGDIDRFIEIQTVQKPVPEHQKVYEKLMPLFDESYDALVDIYEKLAGM